MASVDPTLIRAKQRMAKGKFSINGVNLAPLEKTVALGKRVAEFRAQKTVEAIRKGAWTLSEAAARESCVVIVFELFSKENP